MNKQDMARKLSGQFGFSSREAGLIVDRFFDALARELKAGRRVELRGLGTFEVRDRKPGVGRVPATGAFVPVPALRRVVFRPGKDLKEITR